MGRRVKCAAQIHDDRWLAGCSLVLSILRVYYNTPKQSFCKHGEYIKHSQPWLASQSESANRFTVARVKSFSLVIFFFSLGLPQSFLRGRLLVPFSGKQRPEVYSSRGEGISNILGEFYLYPEGVNNGF